MLSNFRDSVTPLGVGIQDHLHHIPGVVAYKFRDLEVTAQDLFV